MGDILLALGRAVRSLGRKGVFVHLLWPGAVSLITWMIIAVVSWTSILDGLMQWLAGWSLGAWATASELGAATGEILVSIALALVFLLLIYVTAALLVAVFALPLMLERVARRDYSELELRRGGSNVGSVWNAAKAALLFIAGMLVSLPLWLIPGVGLVASVFLTGWLNQRAFGYDALMLHADREELARLPRVLKTPMLLLGGGCALLAYIPVINLMAPAFCGLAFVHFLLEALRRERLAGGVAVRGTDAAPR